MWQLVLRWVVPLLGVAGRMLVAYLARAEAQGLTQDVVDWLHTLAREQVAVLEGGSTAPGREKAKLARLAIQERLKRAGRQVADDVVDTAIQLALQDVRAAVVRATA